MLRLWKRDQSPGLTAHEDEFLDRYGRIFTWALHLTQDRQQAEDLTQDAFLDFTHSKPDLSRIGNLDAFLYQSVRNLHRSQMYRHLRRKQLLASAFEYDSIGAGLHAADEAHRLQVWDELRLICRFACERKESSKLGSVLILRFFHQYMLSEVAQVTRFSPKTISRRLCLIKDEIRVHVQAPGKLGAIDGPTISLSTACRASLGAPNSSEAFLCELRQMIFCSFKGPCFSPGQIRDLYTVAPPSSLDCPTLSHIVSCERCLDVVNRLLHLPVLQERLGVSNSEKSRTDGGSGSSLGGGGGASGSAPKPNLNQIKRWKRRAETIREHQPQKLIILVDGVPRASMAVRPGHNEMDVRLETTGNSPFFVEVLSEQDVRLLSLYIKHPPPEGELKQQHEVHLSEERSVLLCVSFETIAPSAHISYDNPQIQEGGEEEVLLPEKSFLGDRSPNFRLVTSSTVSVFERSAGIFTWRGWSAVTATILAVGLVLYQTEFARVSADTLLANSLSWENIAVRDSSQVIHQTFALEERSRTDEKVVSRRQVEVWRNPRERKKLTQVYDERGVLLSSSTDLVPRPTLANAWQFEPEASNFRQIVAAARSISLKDAKVSILSDRFEITTPTARLILDRATYRPIDETIVLGERKFHFEEMASGTLLERNSPLGAAVRPVEVSAPHKTSVARATGPSQADLDAAELRARFALHRIGADRGEQVSVDATALEIRVDGLVNTLDRKEQLRTALSGIKHVHSRIRCLADLVTSASTQVGGSVSTVAAIARSAEVRPLLYDYLAKRFGDSQAALNFRRNVVEQSKSLFSQVVLLEEFSNRFPPVRLERLTSRDRLLYDGIVADSLAEIEQQIIAQRFVIDPVIGSLAQKTSNAPPQEVAELTETTLPERIRFVTQRVRRINQIVLALFAYTGSSPEGTPQALAEDLSTLEKIVSLETARLRQDISLQLEVKQTKVVSP